MGCTINECLADKLIGELHSIQSEYAIGIPRSSYLSCDNFLEVGMSVSISHAGVMPCLWHSVQIVTFLGWPWYIHFISPNLPGMHVKAPPYQRKFHNQ